MAFQIIRDDITRVEADAIVNTANPKPVYASGTDAAVYKAAGADKLLEERKKIGDINPGEAVYTPAFALNAKYIIHTVGPVWEGGNACEKKTVRQCYENSLALAENLGCESIAFPLIATGTYGFPKDEALQIAISVFSSFSLKSDMDIIMVVFDRESFVLSGKVFSDIDAYIDENYVEEVIDKENLDRKFLQAGMSASTMSVNRSRFATKDIATEDMEFNDVEYREHASKNPASRVIKESGSRLRNLFGAKKETARSETARSETFHMPIESAGVEDLEECGALEHDKFEHASLGASLSMRTLDDLDSQVADTWQEMLFRLIAEKGLNPLEVYKNANINRKHFSKINSNKDYQPKKVTAVAFAISMHLNLDETEDFLARAGYALSPSSKFDLIVRFYIERENYDMFEINEVLFDHGLETIGLLR